MVTRKFLAFQNQHQGLTGGGPQSQTIDPRCCSFQGTNPGNAFQITQKADQHADNPAATQDSSTIGECDTAGNCTVDETATTDFYELITARHHKNATIVTSNRTPDEWLALMHDQLLAQSAVDRLTSACHELIVDGPSYRQRQRPSRSRLDEP